jgi:hypothetical protein
MTDEIKKLDNISDILSSIQANLKVSKEQNNTFGKYKYRKAEDILEAVKKELEKEIYPMCSIITQPVPTVIGDRFFIKCTAILKSSKKLEDATEADGYAELEENKKGMDLAQLTGAATSYAKKYALGNLFAIDDSKDDPDSKDNTKTGTKPKGEFDDWGQSVKGKEWCEKNFTAAKEIIEACKDQDGLKVAWKSNQVTVSRLKKYDKVRYELILDAKDGMKRMLEAEEEPAENSPCDIMAKEIKEAD